MKHIIGLIAAAAIIWSAEAEEKRLPPLSVKTEIAATVRPTHAYILFLAGGQGLTVSDALRDCNQKTAAVSEAIRRQFPDAAIETEIVNTGNRDFGNSDRDSFAPDVTRLIQVTIPADARRAAQILDIALRMKAADVEFRANGMRADSRHRVAHGIDSVSRLAPCCRRRSAQQRRCNSLRLPRAGSGAGSVMPDSLPKAVETG